MFKANTGMRKTGDFTEFECGWMLMSAGIFLHSCLSGYLHAARICVSSNWDLLLVRQMGTTALV